MVDVAVTFATKQTIINLTTQSNDHFVMLTNSIGQELGKGTAGTVFHCPTGSGESACRLAWLKGGASGRREPFLRWFLHSSV